jgi:hypothetical protein
MAITEPCRSPKVRRATHVPPPPLDNNDTLPTGSPGLGKGLVILVTSEAEADVTARQPSVAIVVVLKVPYHYKPFDGARPDPLSVACPSDSNFYIIHLLPYVVSLSHCEARAHYHSTQYTVL